MKRRFLIGPVIAGLMLMLGSVAASATSFTLRPWAFACGHTTFANPATATDTPDQNGCPATDTAGTATSSFASGKLMLTKAGPTSDDLAAGATVGGLVKLTAASFDVTGNCGAGAPRLNVVTADGKIHFFGCAANNHGGHVTIDFSAAGDGAGNGGVKPTDTIKSIDFVHDEQGSATLSNISFSGTAAVTATPTPTATAAPTTAATAAPAHLAATGGGDLPLLPLALGSGLILSGFVLVLVRRRASA